MRTIGLLISHKNNEKRRALLPEDFGRVKSPDQYLFEVGYGEALGISDSEYEEYGAQFASRANVLKQDVLVDVKLGDADYLSDLDNGKILFGWAHAVQGVDFTTQAILGKHTVYAWEELYEDGRYIFYRNREIAGEAAVLHAYPYLGRMPYETRVAIIGNGQSARGAMRVLHGLGAELDVFNRKQEGLFKKMMFNYDVIINCVLWDTSRTDRLIYREDLKKFKPGTMIIDISCDPNMEIESSRPTTIDDPVYEIDGVLHYAVDNTPAMFSRTVTGVLSNNIVPYLDQIVSGDHSDVLDQTCQIQDGRILSDEILKFRKNRGLML